MTYTIEQAQEAGWGDRSEEFAKFMNAVNNAILEETEYFVGLMDLPDWDFASAFESGIDPEEVAAEMLEDQGFPYD